ncbi:hypothetical protein [Streptomyces sp. AK04-3B]|nr:hypothetical protein [Streptomyces sp. AK04-3B]MDX3802550.1 hypothetical protein [Streptomyces sp. AK04-3B]
MAAPPAVLAAFVVAFGDSKPADAQEVVVSETVYGNGFTAPRPSRHSP